MFKKALVSVSDKTGLIEFLRPLVQQGLVLISTGGTANYLREAGFSVQDVSDYTGHPEVMDGRVKTLHPKVHMALLARAQNTADQSELVRANITMFDLVLGNLYPFAQTAEKYLDGQATWEQLVENIDIGGPSFLRSAAKNYESVTVLCDPADYKEMISPPTIEKRKFLASKVFAHTAKYDSMIALMMAGAFRKESSIAGQEVLALRYGENPHQKASWYAEFPNRGLHTAQVLQGKPLSYNNILDLDAALKLAVLLKKNLGSPAVVAVKHNNPCGAAAGAGPVVELLKKAMQSDPVSVFGGIVALTEPVDEASAQALSSYFIECILAPDFSESALKVLGGKKNLRVLKYPRLFQDADLREIRTVQGGFLQQDLDMEFAQIQQWQFPEGFQIEKEPTVLFDMKMAEVLCAGLKSNSIAIVKGGQTIGLGMGQVNRVDAVKQALERMNQHHPDIQGGVLASDAFFPFPDSIDLIAQSAQKKGVGYVLQPGGSVKDTEVIAAALKNKIPMVMTGTRHFRH